MLEVNNNAQEAIHTIKFHMLECDKRQVRIEKSNDEIKSDIRGVDARVSNMAEAINTKINNLNYKIAGITACLYVIAEGVKLYFGK